ncbi:MAG: hypothetical protein ABR581_11620 [Thermoleophilaceae bacterium]
MHPSRRHTLLLASLLSFALGLGLLGPAGAGATRIERAGPTASAAKAGHGRHHRLHRRKRRRDVDGDGIPNRRDRDIDGDHIPNRRDRDMDGDHKRNRRDRDMDADGVRNARDRDIDADRIPNRRDRDMDADRVPNTRDRDMDGDGRRNSRDRDIDGDGVPNGRDRDMDSDRISNRLDKDIDGDLVPNHRDSDSDTWRSRFSADLPTVRLPRSFFGVVADQAAGSSGAARQKVLGDIASTHAGTIRQKFEWSRIETSPGVYDFRFYDAYVRDLTARGFSILPVLFDPPSFRSARPAGGGAPGTYPPRSNAQFGAFAALLVRRYGPGGTFWVLHPELPYRPLRSWQVWNEPHTRQYWPSGPDAGQYVAMLRTVGTAIKLADRGAEVVAAGLSDTNIGIRVQDYLRQMYDAGARGAFDTVAVHPYAPAADIAYDIVADVRHIMDEHGDGAKRIWVTEVGWATWGDNPSPFNTGATGQADLIRRTWAALTANRDALKLRGLMYYNWQDLPPYAPSFADFFGLHTGLMDRSGTPKPAFWSFKATVNALTG